MHHDNEHLMINLLKILTAETIILLIIGFGLLGKNLKRILCFRSSTTTSSESFWLQLITGLLVLFSALGNFGANKPAPTPISWIGAVVFLIGGIVQLLARMHLYDDKTLQERLTSGFGAAQIGIYSKLRHPGQTSLLLLLLGACLALDSGWSLALYAILFIPSTLYRISQQEKRLRDQFGERYLAYQSDTKRIIPAIF